MYVKLDKTTKVQAAIDFVHCVDDMYAIPDNTTMIQKAVDGDIIVELYAINKINTVILLQATLDKHVPQGLNCPS